MLYFLFSRYLLTARTPTTINVTSKIPNPISNITVFIPKEPMKLKKDPESLSVTLRVNVSNVVVMFLVCEGEDWVGCIRIPGVV